ncbi:peptidase M23 [Ectothiorhodospiraceae bacterium BW-2]|nr:peptidase M23 [Ectothiorhodospiraceae bacterium BW-2]
MESQPLQPEALLLSTAEESPQAAEAAPPPPPSPIKWHEATVSSGDNLTLIFSRFNLGAATVAELLAIDKRHDKLLHKLRIGQKLQLATNEGALLSLHYRISPLVTAKFERNDADKFDYQKIEREHDIQTTFAAATIEESLYKSGVAAGLSDNLIMELANLFGWDIDFALDIRKGDQFIVHYEELYLDGNKVRDGQIIAAEFTNRSHKYQAFRHLTSNGDAQYFDAEGQSMRKAFLRSPVDFRRISSRFQPERYHPVLGVKRPHRGVDYAAATGTPIKAAGDGKVLFVGKKGGYGNTVILQHGGQFTTLYGHMSRFKRGLRKGERVSQGEIIGYVGSTGLATGPHLHYEFRVNGTHKNPLTVKFPDAEPIEPRYRSTFLAQATRLQTLLERYQQSQLALND